jgi:hypothetical protein
LLRLKSGLAVAGDVAAELHAAEAFLGGTQ